MTTSSLYLTWEQICYWKVLNCSRVPFCSFRILHLQLSLHHGREYLGLSHARSCGTFWFVGSHAHLLPLHYLGVYLGRIQCLILAVVPFAGIFFHALLLFLHYSRGYLRLWMCLNVVVVPFVSLGSHALSLLLHCLRKYLGLLRCIPFTHTLLAL